MNTRKNTISSVLAADFGIEDFQSGITRRGSEDIHAYDLSNKLGLLSALADRADTDVVTFGSEAYNLLGEAKQLEQYATQQINAANQRFAIAAEIKKGYGVEGFDALVFGCETFKESLTNAFTAVVAAIKKVIQSITNWIRQVINWIGSQFAKGQEKTYTAYSGKIDELKKSNVSLKVARPGNDVGDGIAVFAALNKTIGSVSKNINDGNAAAIKSLTTYQAAPDHGAIQNMKGGATNDRSMNILGAEIVAFGKKINVVKLGSATKAANILWYGVEKPIKVNMTLATYLEKCKIDILTKKSLNEVQLLVKAGKSLIKDMNASLKTANQLAGQLGKIGKSQLSADATKEDKKKVSNEVKASRKAVSFITQNQRLGSLYAGVLYATFANYLRTRSSLNSLIKASVKGSKDESKLKGKKKEIADKKAEALA